MTTTTPISTSSAKTSPKMSFIPSGDREIVVAREFDAPRELVFQAMTQPDWLRRWMLGPPGWSMTLCEEDLRVGGAFRWAWRHADGNEMSMHGIYRELLPPERIVRTESFESGCAAHAGEQLVTLSLTQQSLKTTITLAVLYPSQQARDAAVASGMEAGIAASYDRLDQLLAENISAATLHMHPATDRIQREILLNAPRSRVWRALANAEEFGDWFGVALKGQTFAAGKTVRGQITYPGYEHVVFEAMLERLEPEKVLSFRWHPYAVDPHADYSTEPTTLVVFELKEAPGGTLLTVVESGFDALPQSRGPEAFEMNSGGWEQQMRNIEKYLATP